MSEDTKEYACVYWCVDDVMDTYPEVTLEQAHAVLVEIESRLVAYMVQAGWGAIYDAGSDRGWKTRDELDGDDA